MILFDTNIMILLLKLLAVSLYYLVHIVVADPDYCTIRCEEGQHTMCRWDRDKVSPMGECKGGAKTTPGLTADVKKALLREHNLVRQKIAQGKLEYQPEASRMMKLKWNKEAATIAQRWANQCINDNDACRDLEGKVGRVGQNVFMDYVPENATKMAAAVVAKWLEGVKNFVIVEKIAENNKTQYESFGREGHYSQLVWGQSTDLGCGALEFQHRKDKNKKAIVVCNYYPGQNATAEIMYKRGKACSECPNGGKCSKTYPGLCLSAGDNDNDDDDDIKSTSSKKSGTLSYRPSPVCTGGIVLFVLLLLF